VPCGSCSAWLAPTSSDACEPPCLGASAAPADGGSLPANVSALPVFAGYAASPICGATCTPQVLELRDGAGEVVPSDVVDESSPCGWMWLVPRQPLLVGAQYRLLFSDPCAPTSCLDGATHAVAEHGFTVVDAVPRPSSLASVVAGEPRFGTVLAGTSGGGSCVQPVEAVSRTLAFMPDADAAALLPVIRWTVLVDGNVWAYTDYGGVAGDGTVTTMQPPPRWADVLFTRCGATEASGDSGLPEGMHDVTVVARVAGEDTDVSVAQLTVELSCPCTGLVDGTSCVDSNPCTTDDRCEAGTCRGGSTCDDADPCTTSAACAAGACAGIGVCRGGGGCGSTGTTASSGGALLVLLLACAAWIRPRPRWRSG
jgi:hypothetical protein